MSRRVRHQIGPGVQAPGVTTLRIRTRLRVSAADQAVMVALGTHLGRLARADLARRSRAGLGHDQEVWAERKRAITKESSSRWAGAITKASNDAFATARRNQLRQQADLTRAIATLEEKVELTCHSAQERWELRASRAGRKLKFGYRSLPELHMKRQRLQHLRARLAVLDLDLEAGRVHITRGGKRLLRHRLHLDQAGITKEQWRELWDASRWWITANGESGKSFGNETIRVSPEGVMEVDLPQSLAEMANVTMGGLTRYRFQAAVHFSYRWAEWLAQVKGDRAVAYTISFDQALDRVYLDASFTPASPAPVPIYQELLSDPAARTLAVDHNHGFLAPALLDRSGNPVGRLRHIPLATEDLSASTRDGHLRQAITHLLDLAEAGAPGPSPSKTSASPRCGRLAGSATAPGAGFARWSRGCRPPSSGIDWWRWHPGGVSRWLESPPLTPQSGAGSTGWLPSGHSISRYPGIRPRPWCSVEGHSGTLPGADHRQVQV